MEKHFGEATRAERIWIQFSRAWVERRFADRLRLVEEVMALQETPSPGLLAYRAGAQLDLNLLHGAIRNAADVRSGDPGTYIKGWMFWVLGAALHGAGDYAGQARLARSERAARGASSQVAREEVCALAALGRLAELDQALNAAAGLHTDGRFEALQVLAAYELHRHGHREAARDLAARALADIRARPQAQRADHGSNEADLLILLGRFGEARPMVERDLAAATRPRAKAHLLGCLAWLAVRAGDPDGGRKAEADLEAMNDPDLFGEATFHRAGYAAQTGGKDRAVALLKQSLREGRSYRLEFHLDPALEPLWGYPAFEELMSPKD